MEHYRYLFHNKTSFIFLLLGDDSFLAYVDAKFGKLLFLIALLRSLDLSHQPIPYLVVFSEITVETFSVRIMLFIGMRA